MPPKKKSSKTKGKAKPKQKQRQQQSQKIIINLARDLVKQKRQRRAKPRADTQGASSRVLGQFAPLPQYTPPPLINNASSPRPFQQAITTPAVANAFANRAPAVVRQSLAGETPLPTTSLAPPSTLGRQSSVPKLQKAVSELKDLTEKVKSLPDPLPDEAAEFQRNLTAQREFEAGGGGGGGAAEEPQVERGGGGGKIDMRTKEGRALKKAQQERFDEGLTPTKPPPQAGGKRGKQLARVMGFQAAELAPSGFEFSDRGEIDPRTMGLTDKQREAAALPPMAVAEFV